MRATSTWWMYGGLRTVPANEAQARPFGINIIVKVVECLIVDPEMQQMPLEIIL